MPAGTLLPLGVRVLDVDGGGLGIGDSRGLGELGARPAELPWWARATGRRMPQTEQQKIRSRLRSYERKLRQEKKKFGFYNDGAGKRYQIGPHYMHLGDNEGALAAFEWFEHEFDDDVGMPDHSLCWSLALYRAGNEFGAAKKLRQAMLGNLYLLPHLLGEPISELDIWHNSSDAEPGFVEHVHEPYLALWSDEEKAWALGLHESPGFRSVRGRYIEIARALDIIRPGPERSRLVKEMHELER